MKLFLSLEILSMMVRLQSIITHLLLHHSSCSIRNISSATEAQVLLHNVCVCVPCIALSPPVVFHLVTLLCHVLLPPLTLPTWPVAHSAHLSYLIYHPPAMFPCQSILSSHVSFLPSMASCYVQYSLIPKVLATLFWGSAPSCTTIKYGISSFFYNNDLKKPWYSCYDNPNFNINHCLLGSLLMDWGCITFYPPSLPQPWPTICPPPTLESLPQYLVA